MCPVSLTALFRPLSPTVWTIWYSCQLGSFSAPFRSPDRRDNGTEMGPIMGWFRSPNGTDNGVEEGPIMGSKRDGNALLP